MTLYQFLAKWAENVTGIQGLIFALIPVIVYSRVSNWLRHERAPAVLRTFTGGTTVFNRYSEALIGFVNFLTPLFYDINGNRKSFITVYATFLAIALGYTVSLFFLGWAVSGELNVGNIRLIQPYPLWPRLIIGIGWLALGPLAYYSVRHFKYRQARLEDVANRYRLPSPAIGFALLGALLVFGSQYVSQDRSFWRSQQEILYVQLILSLFAFIAIYKNDRYLIGFTYVAAACYGLALGVPILIGIPLAISLATVINNENTPILISSTLVPAAMLAFGYFAPIDFQKSELGALVLGGIACASLPVTVYLTSIKDTPSRLYALSYAILSFFPVWIPVSMSEKQITHPVAYAIMIFWFMVPLLNAIRDSFSWWTTWALLKSLYRQLQTLVSDKKSPLLSVRRAWQVFAGMFILLMHVGLNLIISSILFLVMFFMVIFGLVGIRMVAGASFREYLIDVPALLNQIHNNPFAAEGLWPVLLLFVTLFPALFHLFAIVLGVVAVALAPPRVQHAITTLTYRQGKDLDSEINPAVRRVARYLAFATAIIELVMISVWAMYDHWFKGYRFGDLLYAVGDAALQLSMVLGLKL